MKLTVNDISRNAIVAVLYFVITMISFPISFLGLQFRFSEILILLCFFNPKYIIGLTLGCALSNIFSSLGFIDIAFGILTTLLSCLIIGYVCKHLVFACLTPIVINSFLIGAELYWVLKEPFWLSTGMVCLGETIVMIIGYILVTILKRRNKFHSLIASTQNEQYKF